MRKLAALVAVSTALSVTAAAQSSRPKPLHLELGLFLSTANLPSGIDKDPGLSLSFGGDFFTKDSFALGVDLRGSAFQISDSVDTATVSLSSLLLTGRYRPAGSKAFFGAGLGFGQAQIDINGYAFKSDTEFVYSAEAGVDLSTVTYLVARYQGSSIEGLRGLTLGVGFRF